MTVSGEVLQDGYAGNLTTLRLLQMLCRFSDVDAARYCGVSPHTFRRWRSGRVPSFAAVRLLAIRAGYLPWPKPAISGHRFRFFPLVRAVTIG